MSVKVENLEKNMAKLTVEVDNAEFLKAIDTAYNKNKGRFNLQGFRKGHAPKAMIEKMYGPQVFFEDALNEILSKKWTEVYGIKISTFGVSSVNASEEDEKTIKELQRAGALKNPNMAAATLASAQAQAMQDAAKNTATGPMMAFAGMNMAGQAGGMNAQQLFAMGAQQPQQAAPQMAPQSAGNSWTCTCGNVNTGNFCPNCGAQRPAAGWTCSCGNVNTGNFCTNCGSPKPN